MSKKNTSKCNSTKWDELLDELRNKNLIINDKNKRTIIWYLNEFGYEIIVNDYKNKFLFPFNKEYFMKGTNFQSFIDLFNFDRTTSRLILSDILNIEKRFSNAILISINSFIQERLPIKDKNREKFWTLNLEIKKFSKQPYNEIISKLFNRQNSILKRKVFDFIDLLTKNLSTVDENLKIKDLITLYNENEKISKQTVNDMYIVIKECLKYQNSNESSSTKKLINIIKSDGQFSKIYNEYSKKKILKLILSSKCQNNKKPKTISEASKKWSLGTWIEVFESLNEKCKNNVIDHMFSGSCLIWDKFEKCSTFIEIMRMLQKVRNKCCHNEVIFDYVKSDNKENKKILQFLNQNKELSDKKVNSLNLWAVIKSIEIFDTNNKVYKTKIKALIKTNYEKINKYLLPNDVYQFLKSQVGEE